MIKESNGQLKTIKTDELNTYTDASATPKNVLRDVYVDGKLLVDDTLTMIRERTGW